MDEAPPLLAVDELVKQAPTELLVLTHPHEGDAAGGLELRSTPRGDVAAVAYTSIELLVEACGSGQPWVRIATAELDRIADRLGVTLVALDVWLPEGHRYPEADPGTQPDLEPVEPVDSDGAVFFVPSRPVRRSHRSVVLELQPDNAARPALLAYTSREHLEAGCGPHQAWVAIPAEMLAEAAERSGAQQVLFNPVLAEASRHTGPVLS